MAKFKKGDRVRVIEAFANADSPLIPVGSLGVIQEDDAWNPIVLMDDGSYNTVNFGGCGIKAAFFNEENFELLHGNKNYESLGGDLENVTITSETIQLAVNRLREQKDFSFIDYYHDDSRNINLKPYTNILHNFMNALKKIPAAIKKILSTELQAMYKVGFINEDLSLSMSGKTELLEILSEKHRAELAARAEEIIKETESENK